MPFYFPAQNLVDLLFARWVQGATGSVVFTSGGPGAGRTAILEAVGDSLLVKPSVIIDGTLSDTEGAIINILAARHAGKSVRIAHVHRAFPDAVHGVIDRALGPASGRAIAMEVTALMHDGARKTFMTLRQRFAGDDGVVFLAQAYRPQGAIMPEIAPETIGPGLPSSFVPWVDLAFQLLGERAN